ncbi:MAG TPA: hypothetical protein V6C81_20155 [Planktothrix sp.]|jgi:hypothetical protein
MGSDSVKYKPGESVTCRIKAPEPGGYLVEILPSGIEGFLPSQEPIELGRQVPGTFVCMSNGRALMAYAFMIGTTERVQLSTASDSETAFAVWADSYPRTVRLRRAVDLFMPPFASVPSVRRVKGKDALRLIDTWERGKFTGCIKVAAQQRLSRSACLYYNGRAVGSVYTKKPVVDPFPVEMALEQMMDDLQTTETQIESYDLPSDLVLSMSSMFLGVLVQRPEDSTTPNFEFANELIEQFAQRKETACITLNDASQQSLCGLVFISDGLFKGAYSIEERRFRSDREYLEELFDKFLSAKIEAYMLPEVLMTSEVKFGYALTGEQFRHKH